MSFAEFIENQVNMIGKELSGPLSLTKGRAWNQEKDNCYLIAKEVAARFGYEIPTYADVSDIIMQQKQSFVGWGAKPNLGRSPANLIVYEDDALHLHVSFEYKNKEFNYAHLPNHKFLMKIPLKRLPSQRGVEI